jgi:hypothetical protein
MDHSIMKTRTRIPVGARSLPKQTGPIVPVDIGKLYILKRKVIWPASGDDSWPVVGRHEVIQFDTDELALKHFINNTWQSHRNGTPKIKVIHEASVIMLLDLFEHHTTSGTVFKLLFDGQIYYSNAKISEWLHEAKEHHGSERN